MAEVKTGTIKLGEEAGKELLSVLRKHGVLGKIADDIKERDKEEMTPEQKLLNRIFGDDEEWEEDEDDIENEDMYAVYFALLSTFAEEGYNVNARLMYDADGLPMISADIYKDER